MSVGYFADKPQLVKYLIAHNFDLEIAVQYSRHYSAELYCQFHLVLKVVLVT